jgi:hypothetical protein
MGTLLAWILAHQSVIGGVVGGLLQIIGGASVVVNAAPMPKKTQGVINGVLNTAHDIVSVAALDFSKFQPAKDPKAGT